MQWEHWGSALSHFLLRTLQLAHTCGARLDSLSGVCMLEGDLFRYWICD